MDFRNPILAGILLGAISGALAAVLTVLIVRGRPRAGKYRILIFAGLFIALYAVSQATLGTGLRGGSVRSQAETLIDTTPALRLMAQVDSGFRGRFVDFLVQLDEEGVSRQEALDRAAEWGRQMITPQVMRFLPQASDSAALAFARAFTGIVGTMRADDPVACAQFLFGPAPGTTAHAPQLSLAQQTAISDAFVAILTTATTTPTPPPDSGVGALLLQELFARIQQVHGEAALGDVAALADPTRGDPARVCNATYIVYSTALELPPEQGGPLLRFLFAGASESGATP